ncbi:MAG: RNA methyltransferase [Actinomycetes bacterium]
MITSSDNPAIKEVRRLQSSHARTRSDLFVAEGEDLAAVASASGWNAVHTLVREGSGLEGDEVQAELLDSVSALGSGTRIISVFEKQFVDSPGAGMIIHLEGLRDPGNVGTLIRSAHAFGATAVSFGDQTADPYNPKSVRASMGSVFAVPLVVGAGIKDLPGVKVGLVGGAAETAGLPDEDVVLILGAERLGLSSATLELCNSTWSIPMPGGAESLNAAVACSIAMYAVNRIQSS